MTVPYILETARLKIRELTVTDAANFYVLNEDPEVLQYTGDKPFDTITDADAFLKNYIPYATYGMGRWAVELKTTNQFLGWCGLNYSPERQEVDLGFRFFRALWNQGFATEASLACLDYGFTILRIDVIIGRADARNVASIRVLEKIGMTFWKEVDIDGHQGFCYSIETDHRFIV